MENYLHDGSNVITINSLNTIIAIALEKFKLGEVAALAFTNWNAAYVG